MRRWIAFPLIVVCLATTTGAFAQQACGGPFKRKKPTDEQLTEVLASHQAWMDADSLVLGDERRAKFREANLRGANMRATNLFKADLSGANLTGILANGTLVCAELDGSGGRTEPPEPPPLLCDTFDCAAEIADECADAATFASRITCAHNVVRKFASPAPAVPLVPLTYEQSLVEIAQPWADGCVERHNPGRSFGGSTPGENLAFFSDPSLSSTAAAEMTVKLWTAEREFYDVATNTCEIGETCGHYTQLVWDDTNLLGCGIATSCDAPFSVHVVCNYFPPGNFIGDTPYDLP